MHWYQIPFIQLGKMVLHDIYYQNIENQPKGNKCDYFEVF